MNQPDAAVQLAIHRLTLLVVMFAGVSLAAVPPAARG